MSQNPTVETVSSSQSVAAHVAEAKAFIAKVEALAAEGNKLGNLALEEVARHLGASCANKFGRPSEIGYVAFMLAMQHRNLSIGARTQLAQVANKAAMAPSPERKPVFKTTANANSLQGGFAYKLNMPATFDAAIS